MKSEQSYRLQDIEAREGMVLIYSKDNSIRDIFTYGREYVIKSGMLGFCITDDTGDSIYIDVAQDNIPEQLDEYSYDIFDTMYFYIKEEETVGTPDNISESVKDKEWPQVGDSFMLNEDSPLAEGQEQFIGEPLEVISKTYVKQHEEPVITCIHEDGRIDCTLGDYFIKPIPKEPETPVKPPVTDFNNTYCVFGTDTSDIDYVANIEYQEACTGVGSKLTSDIIKTYVNSLILVQVNNCMLITPVLGDGFEVVKEHYNIKQVYFDHTDKKFYYGDGK